MTASVPNSVRALLLSRCSVVALSKGTGGSEDDLVRAVELELAELGYLTPQFRDVSGNLIFRSKSNTLALIELPKSLCR